MNNPTRPEPRPAAAYTRTQLTGMLVDDAEIRGDLPERAAIRLLDRIGGIIGTPEFAECVRTHLNDGGTVITAYIIWGQLAWLALDDSGTAVMQIARSIAADYPVNLETCVPRLNAPAAKAVAEAILAASGHKTDFYITSTTPASRGGTL